MRILGPALLGLALATAAQAQTAQTPAAPPTAESLDRGLSNLGLMAGHAVQCLPEAEQAGAQRAILLFNSKLVAELGSNAAFRFASAFGAGSSHEIDRQFCDRSLADWRKLVQEHGLNR